MTIHYDPSQHFDLEIQDLRYRNDPARTLLARIYQPKGRGPFPTLLDVHGGEQMG